MLDVVKKTFSKFWLYRFIKLIDVSYFRIRKNLKVQLANSITDHINSSRIKVFIPLLELSHYQVFQVLALAKAFEFRGAQVKVLICDSFLPGCEIKSYRSPKLDPCLSCRFHRNNVLELFNIDILYLSDIIDPAVLKDLKAMASVNSIGHFEKFIYNNVDLAPSVNDSIIRYYYGDVPTENDLELSRVREKHLLTALINLTAAEEVNKIWGPDILFNNMSVYSSWEPFYRFFEYSNVKTSLMSISQFNYNAVTINSLDLFKNDKRFKQWLKERENKFLNKYEDQELDNFLTSRFKGESKIFQDYAFFDPLEAVNKHISVNRDKRNLFLFSNIYWDIGMSESSSLFDGVVNWVLETIRIVECNSDCHLYIKPHPGEVYDGSRSLKGVRDFIFESFPVLPKNVTIIHPEFKLKTYELFPYIDLGLVYNGTLGLEMMLFNIPVIVCGLSPYSFLNSATVPDSIDRYRMLLTNRTLPAKVVPMEVRLFSYFYFIKTMIPWTLTKTAYADSFEQFAFNSINDLREGEDKYLDHICNSILKADSTTIESW